MKRPTGKTGAIGAGRRYLLAAALGCAGAGALWGLYPRLPDASFALVFCSTALAALLGRGPGLLALGAVFGMFAWLRLGPALPAALGQSEVEALLLHLAPALVGLEGVVYGSRRVGVVLPPDPNLQLGADFLPQLGAVTWEAEWRQALDPEQESLRVLRVSEQIEALLEYPRERWTDEPGFHLSLVHPEDRARFRDFCSRCADGEVHGAVEYRLVHAAGHSLWVRHLMTARPTTERGLVLLRGLLVSIADRKEAEETLRESEAWYRRIVETASEGIVVLDAERKIVYLNRRMARMLGARPERVVGQPVVELLAEADRDYARIFLKNLKPDHTDQRDFRLKKADGSQRWVLASACSVRREGDTPRGALMMVTDVTERREAEDALQTAARAKDEFLAMLAHELRNPLGALRNSLEVLRLAPDDASARERALDVAERQLAHQVRMVDDLLDVSRITRGKVELRRQSLDLNGLARDAVEDHRDQFGRREVALMSYLPANRVPVYGDPTRLAQVLTNLLQNALKFTDAGGAVELRLRTEGEEAVLTVSDDGVGIAPEMLPRVFDTFAQADRSLARSRGGLGLGLALVRGLVELHGGRVEARSTGPGQGAEFSVRLPLVREAAAEAPQHAEPAVSGSCHKVLVVEDIEDAAETLRDLLELAGHEVVLAGSGPAGLEAVWKHRPQVVLCDIGLPEMDGYEVVRRIRERQNGYRPFVVAVTGYGTPADRQRALEAGFDAHMVKPVQPEQLLRLLSTPAEEFSAPAAKEVPDFAAREAAC